MTDVILKGELHTSLKDFKRERELLKTDLSAVVFEGQADEAEFGIADGWFQIALFMFDLTLLNLYTDKTILQDLADARGLPVQYTRESELELLENSNLIVNSVAAGIFYLLVPLSIIYGALSGDYLFGSLWLLVGALLPIVIIRIYETIEPFTGSNRDEIIADTIEETVQENGKTLAIVGGAHLQGIKENLDSELDVKVEAPEENVYSFSHIKSSLRPGFAAFSMLYVLFILVVEATRLGIGYL